jgi:undecaprenyl-diphosphatase
MIRHWFIRIRAIEKSAVAAMVVVAASVWAFGEIADEMMDLESQAFDTWVLLARRTSSDLSDPIGPGWFEEMMRDFTALGSIGVMLLFVLGAIGLLMAEGKRRAAMMVTVATVGGMALSYGLKIGFARPRPDLVPHSTPVYIQSFPSGHALMAAVVYLTLGMLLARTQSAQSSKVFILCFATFLAFLVGVSRLYLGVHWPTDVLAGWAGGAAWAFGSWLVMYWLQGRGEVESEAPSAEEESHRLSDL